MRFAHMADCHIGAWREPRLSSLNTTAFEMAVQRCIDKSVDFIVISGDLFNTSLPGIDKLKSVVVMLKKLMDFGIPVYVVAGSHDFSPSGKTMLDVLETAGLINNVVRGRIVEKRLQLGFTVDEKTGVKLAGMIGKKGMLEKSYYEDLDRESLEKEKGFKIFMFHTALSELKPKGLEKMESAPVSFLPKGFSYYAAGHVHEVIDKELEPYGRIVYPGPLFPNNFKELEKLQRGGFYIYEDGNLSYEPLQIKNVFSISLDCSNMAPEQVEAHLMDEAKKNEFINTIVTIRLSGRLSSGKLGDIRLGDVMREFYAKGAYFVMKNTSSVSIEGLDEVMVRHESVEETEDLIISEHLGQIKLPNVDINAEKELTHEMIQIFQAEKKEGETRAEYESRLREGFECCIRKHINLKPQKVA